MADSTARATPNEEWDDLMRQLRTRPTAPLPPFFYGRVRARLAAEAAERSPSLLEWLRRPAYAVLLGALVLSLSGDNSGADSAIAAAYPSAQPRLPR